MKKKTKKSNPKAKSQKIKDKKEEYHDIESVLDVHIDSKDLPKNATVEQKEEFIENRLEDIGEAIEKEITESQKDKEEPVAVFVKDKETAKDIKRLRKVFASGFHSTHKNMVVFYDQASEAGDRVRGFIYVLLGFSIMFMGFFAKDINFVTFRDILIELTHSILGQAIVFTIGFSLFAYGTRKFFHGIWTLLKQKFRRKKKRYIQKKLI